MRRNFSASVFGLLFWLIFVEIVSAQRGGTWGLGAPMPVARQELATGGLDGSARVCVESFTARICRDEANRVYYHHWSMILTAQGESLTRHWGARKFGLGGNLL